MVFDWFRRGAGTSEPDATAPAQSAEPSEPTEAEAAEAPKAGEPPVSAADGAPQASQPMESGAGGAPPQDASASQAPAVAGGVDEDALAWARQAYARLKAQQELMAPVSAPPDPAVSAPADPGTPVAEEQIGRAHV
mgnify:FL=1